ncbi:sensor histidine kinase [Methylobacter tundripaludum]|uniref:sensor histidine kinase n=1 Tax=Methylobacter tundripaludum TaxID=173365 RepID=UPI000484000C|nr:sensor histidine kinase [Methylobacter tundripaludum]
MTKTELHWKFDVSTFRLLGRELITDRITALVELVKNAYDANATEVHVEFYETRKNYGKIIIRDNGIGMNQNDIETKWMRIGTDSKRKDKFSPAPFNRRVVGEKGIGRFAIDKLGSLCVIETKNRGDLSLNYLIIDWRKYEDKEKISELSNFTEINNTLIQKKSDQQKQGTKIIINYARDIWTENDIERANKELSKIISPLQTITPSFNIFIFSNKYSYKYNHTKVINRSIEYASHDFKISFDKNNNIQEAIKFDGKKLIIDEIKPLSFGLISFQLYYFNQSAKGNFTKSYKGEGLKIDGVKIYRDGVLSTPFAEYNDNQDKMRDVLGIDKRRWSGFFDKLGLRDLIGIISISRDENADIIDSTNRQDFIDNEAYRDLKEFIISQIHELEKLLQYNKKQDAENASQDLKQAIGQLDFFKNDLSNIKNDIRLGNTNSVVQKVKQLEDDARKINFSIKQGIKNQETEKQDSKRRESMLLSLMSIQTYALEIVHIIKTSLGMIKRRAEFLQENIGLSESFDENKLYSNDIYNEINKLSQAIDFMSSYTKSGDDWCNFEISQAINDVFNGFSDIAFKENIKLEVDIEAGVELFYNQILFGDIITNLINNSIKALVNVDEKIIKCIGYSEKDQFIIIFSDNGYGIQHKIKNKIFEIFFTTTSEFGGQGMGLYMVKTNMEAIHGHIDLIDSEFDTGVTFKLMFPYKKENL